MAAKIHLEALKGGHLSWQRWRRANPYVYANLRGLNLDGYALNNYDLSNIDFDSCSFLDVTASNCDFSGCNFRAAKLRNANFTDCNLRDVDFIRADMTGTDLTRCKLHRTVFRNAKLAGTIFKEAKLYETIFVRCDLSACIDIGTIKHQGHSVVDFDTIRISKRSLPLNFLRGCGVPEVLIGNLTKMFQEQINYYSCFISYSSYDEPFVRQLYCDLQEKKGVRCWLALDDMLPGMKILDAIDREIQQRDKILLVLSKASIASDWVEGEVTRGLDEERQRKQTVLIPIRIDDSVMKADKAWARMLCGQRSIGDFTRWEDPYAYNQALQQLLQALEDRQEASLETMPSIKIKNLPDQWWRS